MSRRVVVFTQARLASTRLPKKILEDLCGAPLLTRHIERLKETAASWPVMVLAPLSDRDSPLAEIARSLGAAIAYGPETDVLSRFAAGAEAADAEIIVRATSDNPFVDPTLVDRCVERFAKGAADYVTISNEPPDGYPYGLNIEVFSRRHLDLAAREAQTPDEREHVTPFLYRRPDRFRIERLGGGRGAGYRLTVDFPEDLDLARRLWAILAHKPRFGWADCVDALDSRPDLARINAHLR
jgi:spore coat polysaccharide biosynthesis protein SpsF